MCQPKHCKKIVCTRGSYWRKIYFWNGISQHVFLASLQTDTILNKKPLNLKSNHTRPNNYEITQTKMHKHRCVLKVIWGLVSRTPLGAPRWARIISGQALESLQSRAWGRWRRPRWRTTGRWSCRPHCCQSCRRPEEKDQDEIFTNVWLPYIVMVT